MTTSYKDYTKRGVGQFDPEYAAYLLQQENEIGNYQQEVTQLQTRHPITKMFNNHPWLYAALAGVAFLAGSNFTQPKVQTFQPATSQPSAGPTVINIKN